MFGGALKALSNTDYFSFDSSCLMVLHERHYQIRCRNPRTSPEQCFVTVFVFIFYSVGFFLVVTLALSPRSAVPPNDTTTKENHDGQEGDHDQTCRG